MCSRSMRLPVKKTPRRASRPKTSIARSGTPCWGRIKSNYEQLRTASLHYNTNAQPDLATRSNQGWSLSGEANEGKQKLHGSQFWLTFWLNNLAKQIQTRRCCRWYFWPGSCHVCFCVVCMGGNCSYISTVCYQFTHVWYQSAVA